MIPVVTAEFCRACGGKVIDTIMLGREDGCGAWVHTCVDCNLSALVPYTEGNYGPAADQG